MLRKLFYCIGQSNNAPLSSVPSPPEEVPQPEDSDVVDIAASPQTDIADIVDTSVSSLPMDLLLQIFLHLQPADVICCAGVCKPWRRFIIGNAAILGPHLDRFGTSLLLGIFHYNERASCLRHVPGPFQSAIPLNACGSNETPANSLIPAALSTLLSSRDKLLSSRDGFILLTARRVNKLCLCNPMTGYCTIVPAAAGKHNMYFLLPSSLSSDDGLAVQILAVHRRYNLSITFVDEERQERLPYQLFSTTGNRVGVWGAVVQGSGHDLEEGRLCVRLDRRSMAVGQDTIYWLAGPDFEVTCVFALDVCTGRTWTTTRVPIECRLSNHERSSCIMAMSGDGQLSLVQSHRGPLIKLWVPRIKVWVLSSDTEWTVQRTISIDMYNLLPHCPFLRCFGTAEIPWLTVFCPQSRCVVALWSDHEFLIDIEGDGSGASVRRIGNRRGHDCWPYEMDSSSTYISKMKHF